MAKYKVGDKVVHTYKNHWKYFEIVYVGIDFKETMYFGKVCSLGDNETTNYYYVDEYNIKGLYDEDVTITISKQTYDLLKEQLK